MKRFFGRLRKSMSLLKKRRFPKTSKYITLGDLTVKVYSPDDIKKRFQREKKIGTGAHGKAGLYKDRKSGKLLVIKEISLEKQLYSHTIDEFVNYLKLSKFNKFPRLVKHYDVGLIKHGSHYSLILMSEYLKNGTLYSFVRKGNDIDWYPFTIAFFKTLHSLHKYGFVHRDIHAQNIFIDEHGNFKIGDFGYSCLKHICAGKSSRLDHPLLDVIQSCNMFIDVIPTDDPSYKSLKTIFEQATYLAYCVLRRMGWVLVDNNTPGLYKGRWARIEDVIIATKGDLDLSIPKICRSIKISADTIANKLIKAYRK
jgi:serine/threonine protein kinase